MGLIAEVKEKLGFKTDGPKTTEIPMFKDAITMSKLTAEPEEVEIRAGGEKLKCWLHPLGAIERNHVRASSTQAYLFWKEQGGDMDNARVALANIIVCLTIFFVLRLGPEKKAPRVFENQESVLEFDPVQANDLYAIWNDKFNISEADWGNFLRARKCGTSPALSSTGA